MPAQQAFTKDDVYAMFEKLGDVAARLEGAGRGSLAKLYDDLRIEVRYEHQERAAYVSASPRVFSECVRGGT